MLSSDISHDDSFSSIFIKNRSINQICPANEEKESVFAEVLSKNNITDFSVNHSDLLASKLGHGPFLQFVDDSVKFDFLGKKDFNLIGHTHPLHIKDLLDQNVTNSQELQILINSFFQETDFSLKVICNSHNKVITKTKNMFIKNKKVITFEDSFYHLNNSDQTSLILLNRKNDFSDLRKQLEQIEDRENYILALDIQNERTFDLHQHALIDHLSNWAKEHNLSVWINETYGFARHKHLSSLLNTNYNIKADIITCGNALIGFYLLTQSSDIQYESNADLSNLLIKNAISTLNFLKEGRFWHEVGRISQIEKSFSKILNKLKDDFPHKKIAYSISGNILHLTFDDQSKEKIKDYSITLFEHGILAGTQKTHGQWLRFKLPTSLSNQHFKIIENIFHQTINN